MTDGTQTAISRVSFTDIEVPGGYRAFMLEDTDNGNTLTFIEIGNGTDEWAVKRDDDPMPDIISTAEARRLALESDQVGIGSPRPTELPQAA